MNSSCDFLDALGNMGMGFPTLLIAIATVGLVCVGVKQANISKQQTNLSMFDKRFSVYERVREFFGIVKRTGVCDYEDVKQYRLDIRQAQFLFDKEFLDYLEEIACKGGELATAIIIRDPSRGGNEEARNKASRDAADIGWWFSNQYDELDKRIAPFLKSH